MMNRDITSVRDMIQGTFGVGKSRAPDMAYDQLRKLGMNQQGCMEAGIARIINDRAFHSCTWVDLMLLQNSRPTTTLSMVGLGLAIL